jgi:plastocyanin
MRALQILDWRATRSWRRAVLAFAVVVGLGLMVSGGASLASAAATPAGGPVITIKNFAFTGDLTVLTGATVVVRNADTVMHTLTAADGGFTTRTIQPGRSATFTAPKIAGNYAITCTFHPGMAGTLTVGVKPPRYPVITIKNFAFAGDLTVRPGSTVTVRNADTVMHTLTADDGSFTTPTIQPGGSATFKAPKAAGNYAITCNFHPGMAGTLTVGEIVTPPPPPPAGPVITISGFAFDGTLTVPPGATVMVRNDDPIMHTLTAEDGSFTTPTIDPGTSATFTAPATPGDYPITCNFHPFMAGTLTVAHH